MTTEELKEEEIVNRIKRPDFNANNQLQESIILESTEFLEDDSIDDIITDSIPHSTRVIDTTSGDIPESLESSIESELIQMAWSTSLETPQKATDTTLILEQLNLNFDDCIDDDLMLDFEEPPQEEIDPLGLDALTFPVSQFLCEADHHEIESEKDDFLDEIISVFEEETKSNVNDEDEFDFDITMSQFPSTQVAMPQLQKQQQEQQYAQYDFSVSFSTGRGVKLPPPSEVALKRAAQLIEPEEATREQETSLIGFKTGRGKELPALSKEAMKRARSLVELDENEKENEKENKKEEFPMFTTGRGKALPPPSEEAMKRAKSLIETDSGELGNDSRITDTSLTVGFSTGGGKALPPPSEEALARASKMFDTANDTVPAVGFSTGGGKVLPPPSDAAMKKAASLIGATANKKPLIPGNTAFKPPSLVKSETTLKAPPKPFSLSTAWKRPRRIASAENSSAKAVKIEPVKLFDLSTEGMQRFKLKEFFKTTPNLHISDYTSYGISENVLRITSRSARDFKFPDGWGYKEAHESLLQSGAQSVSISLDWTANHFRWIIWKFASILRTFPEKYSIANLSPAWVLQQLLYRYEREIHQCHRSALKKIIERDDAAGKYLCLLVSGIDAKTRSIEVSDGWYSIWTGKLDNPFWELIVNQKIFEGMKIEISGASLTGQDAIPALEASAKDCQCRLLIARNSCRPARWDTKLGFICTPNRAVAFLKHLHQIHPQGGPIPAISLIVERVYPLLFREDSGDNHVARNEKDHYLYLESNPEQAFNSKFTPIQRIKVIGNTTLKKEMTSVLISFWNPLGEDQRALLQEGTAVIITNLRANSKSTKLSLVSTKSTRIFRDEKRNFTSSIYRIELENYFSLSSNLKLNEFYDVQGIVLGRVGSFFWICGSQANDQNTFLICLKNFNSNLNVRGDLINFRDLMFNHFDAREGVAHFTFSEYSDFKKDPTIKITMEHYSYALQRFKQLTNNI